MFNFSFTIAFKNNSLMFVTFSRFETARDVSTIFTDYLQQDTNMTLLVSYMCAKIRVSSCLVTDNFGLLTEIAVCKFLRGWRSYGPKPFFILSIDIVCV